MPSFPNPRDGQRVVVKGRELEFSYWPMYRTTRRYGLHSIVYVTNPWATIEASIQARCPAVARLEALGSLRQATYFYRAADESENWAAKPLLLYYAFMNLGKAYALTKGPTTTFDLAHHGIIERRHHNRPGIGDAFVRVFHKPGRNGPNLFAHFLDAIAGTTIANDTDFDLPKLLPQVVAGHRLWCDGSGRKERFVPIKEIQFKTDPGQKTVWLEIHLFAQDLTRLGITHKRLLTGCGLDAEVREVTSNTEGTKRVLVFEQRDPVQYNHRVSDVIPQAVDRVRKSLWTIVRSDPPFRKYYVYVVPADEAEQVLPQLGAIYAVMFYMGSVTRYRPQQFDELMKSSFGAQLQELLTAQPPQFLYLMASEFSKREVTRPAIV